MMVVLAIATVFLLMAIVNALFWPRVRKLSSRSRVSVLIPARNEEENLPNCLLDATATDAAEILVYDDHSTDGTASMAQTFAVADSRVRLIDTEPLPLGWTGKSFACSRLAAAAQSEWLLFIDADARFCPDAPSRIVAEAEARKATMLSCWPRISMQGFWECTLMPMLNFVVFSIFPSPFMFTRNEPSLGLAHGACILVDRRVYRDLGGHSLVRNEIFEDTRLAQEWRRRGERQICLDGSEVVAVRMYRDLPGIWGGFCKNFYPAFLHKANYWLFIAIHFAVYVLPLMAGWWKVALIGYATRMVLTLRHRHPFWSVLLHPLAETVMIALGLASFVQVISGRGISWKGRTYRTT